MAQQNSPPDKNQHLSVFVPDLAGQHEHVRRGQQQPLAAHLRLKDPTPASQRPPEDRLPQGRAHRVPVSW